MLSPNLSNAHLLDDNMTYNAGGDVATAIADSASSIMNSAAQIKASKANKTDTQVAIQSACGKKPLLGKKKIAAYKACSLKVLDNINKVKTTEAKAASDVAKATVAPKKAKGISTGLIIGLSVLGLAVVVVTGVAIYKNMGSKAIVQPQI